MTTNLERAKQALIHAHHGPRIVEFAAVIGCAEQRDQLPLGEELITILDHLMSAADEVHVVFLQETRNDIGAKRKRDTSVVLAPTGDVLVRIGPEKVAEQATVGNLRESANHG